MDDQAEAKQSAPDAPQEAPQPTERRQFHEETISGQAFQQYDPVTGWAWIGVHLPSFPPFTARAIFASMDATIMLQSDQRQGEAMRKAQLANGVKQTAGRGIPMPEFVRKLMKH